MARYVLDTNVLRNYERQLRLTCSRDTLYIPPLVAFELLMQLNPDREGGKDSVRAALGLIAGPNALNVKFLPEFRDILRQRFGRRAVHPGSGATIRNLLDKVVQEGATYQDLVVEWNHLVERGHLETTPDEFERWKTIADQQFVDEQNAIVRKGDQLVVAHVKQPSSDNGSNTPSKSRVNAATRSQKAVLRNAFDEPSRYWLLVLAQIAEHPRLMRSDTAQGLVDPARREHAMRKVQASYQGGLELSRDLYRLIYFQILEGMRGRNAPGQRKEFLRNDLLDLLIVACVQDDGDWIFVTEETTWVGLGHPRVAHPRTIKASR